MSVSIFNFKYSARLTRTGLILLIMILSLIFLERNQIRSGFVFLPGDRYDAVISTTILEHWFNFFRGRSVWSEVNYFYPYTRTIAQTDAYFLIGVAYAPFRFLGFDPFISHEFAGIVIKAVGFLGAYFFTRKAFGFTFWFALLAAILFTLSNGMTSHSSRLQLSTVALTPTVLLLLWNALECFWRDDSRGFLKWGIFAGGVFGAWCLTCFYMAWFFAFYIFIFLSVSMLKINKAWIAKVLGKVKDQYINILVVSIFGGVFLLPFVYAFLPKSQEVGVRSYSMALANTIPLEAILQVGKSNLLYGSFYNKFLANISPGYVGNGEYYNTGFSLALFYFFVVGFLVSCKKGMKERNSLIICVGALSVFVSLVMVLSIHGSSAWFFAYNLFPGAKALNAISTFLIFLAFPIIVVAVDYLRRQKISIFVLAFISAILIIGEINAPDLNLDRRLEMRRLSISELPPSECKVFYVSGWLGQEVIPGYPVWINAYYAHNVTGMLISQILNLPTINGVASFNPPDWNFGFPNNADYDARIVDYAKKHKVFGLCRLDLNSKSWSLAIK